MEKINRKISREKAVIGIYQYLLTECDLESIYAYLESESILVKNESNLDFSKSLVNAVIENKNELMAAISEHLKSGWSFERLGYIERAILLVASCEMIKLDMPKTIIINEAVELCKTYCDDESYKYINGVLNSII